MDPYHQYPPYQGQPPPQQGPPHLRHAPPHGSHYGPPPHGMPPMPPMMGGPPPMYPPHMAPPGQPYHAHGAPPHMMPQYQRPPPGHPPHMPPGGQQPFARGPPMSQHRMRPGYGSPPAAPRPPGPGASSAFVIGGALPDKMNTVFIGSIAPGISNAVMEKLLKTTGNLVKWKRVKDPTSQQWKAFGFAEYADADSLLRTLRVLGQDGQQAKGEKPVGLELTAMDGSGTVKALLVKADEKTRQFLDQYEEARPRTIHDTEKDKVALANAKKTIQQMKDGTLDLTESDDTDLNNSNKEGASVSNHKEPSKPVHPGDILAAAAISASEAAVDQDLPEEQKEQIDRELNFFRERAALKEKEKKEEEERARGRSGRQHHSNREREREKDSESTSSSSARGGRDQGGRRMDFVPASGSNHIEIATMGSTGSLVTDQDPAVDSDEEERVRQERRDRELEQSYKDRERRWEQREAERARLYEKDKARDQEYAADMVGQKEAMAHRFAQWNDEIEKDKRHDDYYRDRSRWWQKRQTFLQKEERYDEQDREEEKIELEQEAKKAQEAAETAAKETEDSQANDVSESISGAVEPVTLPTSIKLSLTGGLKRSNGSEEGSGQGTPLTGSTSATEFEGHEDDREVKKRRVLVPLEYSDDEGATSTLSAEEKKKREQQIKDLIQSIPADAQGLWSWPIQWQYLTADNESILKEKIQPFVSKKVVELLGVQEDELTGFVVEHIRKKKAPQELVDELKSALDNDADVLVMKTWRMLIFETESKARKLTSK
ncbi:MAG: hypothetical protein BYD32DRAFT_449415 [Podila humilis]|nr:MAG: hypothetical protein BYD32DRAFT_449415 [Podila humilis]